jgi:hypothetical protein
MDEFDNAFKQAGGQTNEDIRQKLEVFVSDLNRSDTEVGLVAAG